MIVYHKLKSEFLKDVEDGLIADLVSEEVLKKLYKKTAFPEYRSWDNSLQRVFHVLNDNEIPGDAGVAIEYNIPRTGNRIDVLICGSDNEKKENLLIIELKQWDNIEVLEKDGMVLTRFQHGSSEELHPSYQAWSYSTWLEQYNLYAYENKIGLYPCAYLHNYQLDGKINDTRYDEYIIRAPIFCKGQNNELKSFIKQYIKVGDRKELLYKIDKSELKPSKILADTLQSMLAGNEEFIMLDDQKIVLEEALHIIKSSTKSKKKILIVKGGPGTGKSVVAINLLVKMISERQMAQYVTKNSAPRAVFSNRLFRSHPKNFITGLFRGSSNFYETKTNFYKTLIVDEAHRLNEKSGLYGNLGENQIKEIINASQSSIFFLDEDQRVTLKDIGSVDEIQKWGKFYDAEINMLELKSQFRCSGSDAFLSWLDNTLQIKDTANTILSKDDHDFRIFSDLNELRDQIFKLNQEKNSARIVAGYCWNWISKNHPGLYDIQIPGYDFNMRWNLASEAGLWITSPTSVNEVGCIHTCQGLELEYIGVIVGDDITVRNGEILVNPSKRAKTDQSLRGWKNLIKENPVSGANQVKSIIKNTYRTLMTRGMKGCYVYFMDKEVEKHFRSRINFDMNVPAVFSEN